MVVGCWYIYYLLCNWGKIIDWGWWGIFATGQKLIVGGVSMCFDASTGNAKKLCEANNITRQLKVASYPIRTS